MAKAATRKPKPKPQPDPAPAPVPTPPTPPPRPEPPPPEKRYSMTELAALCGVTEQTVRRWWLLKRIPPPEREGRTVFWRNVVGNGIIDTYKLTGAPSITPKDGA